MNNLKKVVGLFFLAIIIWACPSQDEPCEGIVATIVDRTGLDGCTWMLELESGSLLEPTNLDSFDSIISIEEGINVCILYNQRPDLASVCQAGPIIEITELKGL